MEQTRDTDDRLRARELDIYRGNSAVGEHPRKRLGDGSVQFLNDDIDKNVFEHMGARADGKIVVKPNW